MLENVFGAIWTVLTLPIRLVVWVVEMIGRGAGLVVGFVLMVVGIALWAGPLFYFGIPLFVVGLLLTLRNLG
jgi:fucose permease